MSYLAKDLAVCANLLLLQASCVVAEKGTGTIVHLKLSFDYLSILAKLTQI